jgi:hypothetical protein
MNTPPALNTALRASAKGLYSAEASVELLISHGSFLRRNDFSERFVHYGTSVTDGTTSMASIDWAAAITALDTGNLPCSGGEQRIMRIAASLADGIPIDLGDCLGGLDHYNIQLVINAVLHASGQRPEPKFLDLF